MATFTGSREHKNSLLLFYALPSSNNSPIFKFPFSTALSCPNNSVNSVNHVSEKPSPSFCLNTSFTRFTAIHTFLMQSSKLSTSHIHAIIQPLAPVVAFTPIPVILEDSVKAKRSHPPPSSASRIRADTTPHGRIRSSGRDRHA